MWSLAGHPCIVSQQPGVFSLSLQIPYVIQFDCRLLEYSCIADFPSTYGYLM